MKSVLHLDSQQTEDSLPFERLIEQLEQGFIAGCQAPVRHHHTMSREHEADATMLLMPAWTHSDDPQQYIGVKLVNVVPGNSARQLPSIAASYILYDGITGQQIAMMDGNTITARRTAATSVLAARYLARSDASSLLLLGAGRVSSLLAEAYRVIRPIEHVQVWNPTRENALRLVEQLTRQGFQASVCDDLKAGAQSADIISAATLSTTPLIQGEWLSTGTHIDLIGGFRPDMQEVDNEAIRIAEVFVDTDEALIEAGDLVQPINAGVIDNHHIKGTLAQLARHLVKGRTSDDQITCFKAVGSALADLSAATLAYQTTIDAAHY